MLISNIITNYRSKKPLSTEACIHRSAIRFAHTMNWSGRISVAVAFGILPRLFFVFAYINTFPSVKVSEHGIPIEIKYWDSKRSPLSHMVDVTNEFGLKVLAEHNFLNDNNIAFSPYGLIGILVALYEGVDGESSYQIQRSMQLPWNRNIMRIGFRDIHRTLKTYFVPDEGFLAGLALNNENVTFTNTYRDILRFYGFDLQNDPTLPPTSESNYTVNSNTTSNTPIEVGSTTTDNIISGAERTSTESPITITASTTENLPSTRQPALAPSSQSTQQLEMDSTPQVDTTEAPSTQRSSPTMETTTVTQTTTINEVSTINNDIELLSTQQINTQSDSTMELSSTQMSSTENPSTVTDPQMFDEMTSTVSTEPVNDSTLETLERRKKSIVDFIFTSPPNIDDYVLYRSFNIGPELGDTNNNGDSMFLANGLRNIQVSYMQYDTILEYAYLPHLEASALRLPLDSDRYYLLVILPVRPGKGELERLLGRMARESDLSDVYEALRPRRVRATVPSYTVKGHVTLTTDLQKLGIRDVFEPRQRDFTPMTRQLGVYVRSIEQAVSVTIRKYQPDEVKKYVSKRNPVVFSATYPFLYFVMDSNIHVALMAGKMVDPLNTRIL